MELGNGERLRAYALVDPPAEKFRSLLQQVVRNRYRSQDVFDLAMPIAHEISGKEMAPEPNSLMGKRESREMEIGRNSPDNPEVKRRAKAAYEKIPAVLAILAVVVQWLNSPSDAAAGARIYSFKAIPSCIFCIFR